MRVLTFKGSREAHEPIRYDMEDGRSWEFPGDLPSGAFLEFLDAHAEDVTHGVWSYVALRDFLALIRAQNPEVVEDTSISELGVIASDLFNAYIYGTPSQTEEDLADTVPTIA